MTADDTAVLEAGGGPRRSPLARRQRALTTVALVAVVASTGGLIAATQIKSPQQVAAETQAPPATLLTAEVVRKSLDTTVVMRGEPVRGREYTFTPNSVARTAYGPGGDVMVVTAVRTKVGATVKPGKVLLEVSERPVYALPGAFPAYRDMLPGQRGKDIRQLQEALRDLGYRIGDKRGVFGSGTERAVRRFYEDRAYAVPLTSASPADDTSAGAKPAVARADGTGLTTVPIAAGLDATGVAAVPIAAAGPAATWSASPAPQPSVTSTPDPITPTGSGKGVTAAGPDSTSTPSPTASSTPAVREKPMVPMSEVAFLPTLPARVSRLPVRVGDTVGQTLIGFTSGGLSLIGKLDPASGSLAEPGMPVTVLSEVSGFEEEGTIGSVGKQVTKDEETYLPVRIDRAGGWPADLEGDDLRITVTTASTGGEVLAVPEAAISSSADGRTTVTVVEPGGEQRQVIVQPGVSAAGLVEVEPVDGGGLEPGDAVVTGFDAGQVAPEPGKSE
ncbi:hypothetical protein ACTI_79620 [Actinoplanes sp. OR16]|uniref:peptidoglycan-binding protein n=1 Tax=Actinoplanes sp. OR16 TaxID=946334 RepID=UPI000F6DD3B7|nr:peptidoglycan-binding protein [Actinoplanes sp. OR16]BBH71277.1 hypothetical protein ACTI_79620 [Actinoplanes sp. OR16]